MNVAPAARRLYSLAAVGLGTGGALVVAELGLRLFNLAPSAGISTVTESEFRRIPGIFAPNQQVTDRRIPALPFRVRIDSLGYRGVDFPRAKPLKQFRVLAIGDSFTYGDFVADEESLPAQLERALARQCQRAVHVVNAGVGGSTINTHVEMLRRGWVTSPDAVVLTFSENDVSDLRNDMWQEMAENRRSKSRFPLSVGYPVLRRLALWHLALRVRGTVRAARTSEATPADNVGAPSTGLRAEYARLLAEIVAETRSRGRPFVLVAFPSHLTVHGTRTDEQLRWILQVAEAQGILAVNLLPFFRGTGLLVDSLYLLPHDGHASPRGNALAGAHVAEALAGLGACGGARGRPWAG